MTMVVATMSYNHIPVLENIVVCRPGFTRRKLYWAQDQDGGAYSGN